MTFDVMGRRLLDYEICVYDGSRLKFRGPKHDLSQPYVAFLGTTDTFGKFIEDPFPDLLATHLSADAVNLGMVNGGIDAYLNDPAILEVARKADLRVIQIMGALNLSNCFYKVHPRRNDRFLGPQETLVRLFPEVDFTEYHFTRAMMEGLRRVSDERYNIVCRELQDIWLARMTMLLKLLGDKTVLMWFAQGLPPNDAISELGEPALIDAELVGRLRRLTRSYVEVVPEPAQRTAEMEGMLFSALDERAARAVMGPSAHLEAARALQETCLHFLSHIQKGPPKGGPSL